MAYKLSLKYQFSGHHQMLGLGIWVAIKGRESVEKKSDGQKRLGFWGEVSEERTEKKELQEEVKGFGG